MKQGMNEESFDRLCTAMYEERINRDLCLSCTTRMYFATACIIRMKDRCALSE